jgi:methionyl-tRNA formyltransferase
MSGKELRLVFMGTPEFAVASLKALCENGYNVVGVVTAPDKPSGRGQRLTEPPVKKYALLHGLKVLQPEKLKDTVFLSELKKLEADLQVVVAFRMLPEVVWDMPRLGTFNLHASLLPRYRGAAPLNRAIINGDTESGVTTFMLQHEIDTGNIIFQEKTEIGPDDNVEVLHDKLMAMGAGIVLKTVDALADGKVEMISQSELVKKGIKPSHAPKIFKNDCLINWKDDVQKIKNFIRGLSPYPGAWTTMITNDGKEITAKIFRADAETASYTIDPGSIYSDNKTFLKIGCGNGWLDVKEIQLAGKKRMQVDEFLRGVTAIENWKSINE